MPNKKNYQSSWLGRFTHWYLGLGILEKIGVVLLALTGFGAFFVLAKAQSIEGKSLKSNDCRDFIHQGSDFSQADIFLVGEIHEAREEVVSCVNYLSKSRGHPSQVIYEEFYPNNQTFSCEPKTGSIAIAQASFYGNLSSRICRGWDSLAMTKLSMQRVLTRTVGRTLAVGYESFMKNPEIEWKKKLLDYAKILKQRSGLDSTFCTVALSQEGIINHWRNYNFQTIDCFTVQEIKKLIGLSEDIGFTKAYQQTQQFLLGRHAEASKGLDSREFLRARNELLVQIAAKHQKKEGLAFFVAGAAHLTGNYKGIDGKQVQEAIEKEASKRQMKVAVLISKQAQQYLEQADKAEKKAEL